MTSNNETAMLSTDCEKCKLLEKAGWWGFHGWGYLGGVHIWSQQRDANNKVWEFSMWMFEGLKYCFYWIFAVDIKYKRVLFCNTIGLTFISGTDNMGTQAGTGSFRDQWYQQVFIFICHAMDLKHFPNLWLVFQLHWNCWLKVVHLMKVFCTHEFLWYEMLEHMVHLNPLASESIGEASG